MAVDDFSAAVIGLGLIGGSIARDLAARRMRVAGYDSDSNALDAACAAAVVTRRLDASFAGLKGAGIVVIAVPVSVAADVLDSASRHLSHATLIMDVGSTKQSVLAAAAAAGVAERFVGSHPMAGDHRSGWDASRRDLFRNAPVYLCPTPTTRKDSFELAKELWMVLGARIRLMDADAHDARVALTSHLPHAVSAAIALVLSKAGVGIAEVGPGGRDVLRIAASSPELWTAIAMDNREALRRALAAFESELQGFDRALAARDEGALHAFFSAAREWSQ